MKVMWFDWIGWTRALEFYKTESIMHNKQTILSLLFVELITIDFISWWLVFELQQRMNLQSLPFYLWCINMILYYMYHVSRKEGSTSTRFLTWPFLMVYESCQKNIHDSICMNRVILEHQRILFCRKMSFFSTFNKKEIS